MTRTMRYSLLSILLLPYQVFAVTSASCWIQGADEAVCWQNMEKGGQTTAIAYATTDAMNNLLSESTQESCIPTNLRQVALKDVSLSLRWTCEMNRRLLRASRLSTSTHDRVAASGTSPQSQNSPIDVRGGTTAVVHVHPSQVWNPPIPETAQEVATLSIFHARAPVMGKIMGLGAKRWGPDLLGYLQGITTALGVQDNPLVLALSILFLDKACSVETDRQGQCPCPYLLPRTIHRLLVTSLWIATQAVYPDKPPAQLFSKLAMCDAWKSLGMGPGDLQHMEDLMRRAMGPEGVSEFALYSFYENWDNMFGEKGGDSSSSGESRIKIRPRRKSPQEAPESPTTPGEPHQASATVHEQSCYSTATDHARDGAPSSPSRTADAALQCW